MSQLGQYAKSSLRADVFRFAPNIGRYSAASLMGDFDYRAGSQSPPRRERRCDRCIRLQVLQFNKHRAQIFRFSLS